MLDKSPGLWYSIIRKREGKPIKPERKTNMAYNNIERKVLEMVANGETLRGLYRDIYIEMMLREED